MTKPPTKFSPTHFLAPYTHPTRFLDPLGPGTPAWDAFDEALAAFRRAPPRGNARWKSPYMKRYYNQRDRLIQCLNREHASEACIAEWLASLKQQCALPNPLD